MISDGDIVEIVLDAVHVSGPGDGEFERVLVQGAFARGSAHPALPPGAHRNVVKVFFGTDMRSVGAFLIETALEGGNENGNTGGEAPRPLPDH